MSGASYYASGANLGGWLVMEDWLFPNVPLMRFGTEGIRDNQEHDFIRRMQRRGIDPVATMQRHWNNYLCDDLLGTTEPPPLLRQLRDAGVTRLRIPVGWWAFEPPAVEPEQEGPGPLLALEQRRAAADAPPRRRRLVSDAKHNDAGLTADGFVTGGARYLRALLRWLKPLGMRAVLDMHSLPGGATKNVGYTGRYFTNARFFEGADLWAADGNASSLPPAAYPHLRRGVLTLRRLAAFIASVDAAEESAGVVLGMAPWNEALFADDDMAQRLMPPFTLKLLPQLRGLLPPRAELYLNWFNHGRDWAAWMAENRRALGADVLAELHVYHAFDPPLDLASGLAPGGCGMCSGGAAAMRSLICKTCGSDAAAVDAYSSRGIRVVVGEWSLGTCGMWGAHPATIVAPDFLFAFYAAAKSMFAAHGVEADYFWTGVVRTGGYDPTLYVAGDDDKRTLLREMKGLESHGGWAEYNRYVIDAGTPAPPDYLLNWHLLGLAHTQTSSGHAVAPPLALAPLGGGGGGGGGGGASVIVEGGGVDGDGVTLLTLNGSCGFVPAVPAGVAPAMEGSCVTCSSPLFLLSLGALLLLALLVGAVALACCCCCRAGVALRQKLTAAMAGRAGAGPLAPAADGPWLAATTLGQPLLEAPGGGAQQGGGSGL